MIVQTDEQKEAEIERRTQERIALLLDQLDERMLTKEEVTSLRLMVIRDGRVQWLWSTARTLAIWVAAIITGATVGYDALRGILKRIVAP